MTQGPQSKSDGWYRVISSARTMIQSPLKAPAWAWEVDDAGVYNGSVEGRNP